MDGKRMEMSQNSNEIGWNEKMTKNLKQMETFQLFHEISTKIGIENWNKLTKNQLEKVSQDWHQKLV